MALSSIHLDHVTCELLTDPWSDNCSPTCHTLNKSTWDDIASRSGDDSFSCPFSKTVLTIDSLRRNTLVADLVKLRESDKEFKKIMTSSNPMDKVVQALMQVNDNMILMRQEALDREAKFNEKINDLTRVVFVTQQQMENLSNMDWNKCLAMTIFPCSRVKILRSVKNKGISKQDRQFVARVKANLAQEKQQAASAVSAHPPSSSSSEK